MAKLTKSQMMGMSKSQNIKLISKYRKSKKSEDYQIKEFKAKISQDQVKALLEKVEEVRSKL